MSNSSIWAIDRTLSGATTPGQSGPGSKGNEGVLYIPKNTKTRTSPSDCWVSYPGFMLGKVCVCVCVGSYPSAEKQLVYSLAQADWALQLQENILNTNNLQFYGFKYSYLMPIIFQVDQFDLKMGHEQVLPWCIRMDVGLTTMKERLFRSPENKFHHQTQFRVLHKTAHFWGVGGGRSYLFAEDVVCVL